MSAGGDEQDRVVAQALGWLCLLFVVGWAVAGLVVAGLRVVDAWQRHEAQRVHGEWDSVVPLGAFPLLSALSLAAFAALVLGIALGAAALFVGGRALRGASLVATAAIGIASQVLFSRLSAVHEPAFAEPTRLGPDWYAGLGLLLMPVVLLVAVWTFLQPALKARKSMPVPAAGG